MCQGKGDDVGKHSGENDFTKEDRDTTGRKEGISALSGNLVVYTTQQV